MTIAAIAASLSAQEPAATVSIDVALVTVDVAVTDAGGRPLTSLSPDDFLIFEDGRPQEIRAFSPVAAPYNVLLLFDRSASARGRWPLMRGAVASFLSNLRPQDRAAAAIFDDDFKIVSGWRDDPGRILEALGKETAETAGGGTSFYRAVERAVGREFRGVTGRRVAIVLSDGRDTPLFKQTVSSKGIPPAGEDRGFSRTMEVVAESRIPVYFVAMNTDLNLGDPPGEDYLNLQRAFPDSGLAAAFLEEARHRMERLAEISGGRVFLPGNTQDVVSIYEQVSRDLTASYSLGYVSTNAGTDGRYHRIEVRTRIPNAKAQQSREGYTAR